MNHQRISTFYSCSPVLLGIHRSPDWKYFLKYCEFSTATHIKPGFVRPSDMLEIFFVNVNFITIQKRSFGLKKIGYHAWFQKCHFARIKELSIWHFLTRAWNSTQYLAKELPLKPYEDGIYRKNP